MSNDFFQFRQFTILQERCAMKVGTDGTLLGAWAHGGQHILDIGTGTGLIALMMAQRFPQATVVGIDIDPAAVMQARENAGRSPFAGRITIWHEDFTQPHGDHGPATAVGHCYDAIVCNPPYFVSSLKCSNSQRTCARHADTLPYRTLMLRAWQLLADGGQLSVIVPSGQQALMESEATLAGFFKHRECVVRTKPTKPPKRYLFAPFFAEETLINLVQQEMYCPLSKEPDYKKTCVRFERV